MQLFGLFVCLFICIIFSFISRTQQIIIIIADTYYYSDRISTTTTEAAVSMFICNYLETKNALGCVCYIIVPMSRTKTYKQFRQAITIPVGIMEVNRLRQQWQHPRFWSN